MSTKSAAVKQLEASVNSAREALANDPARWGNRVIDQGRPQSNMTVYATGVGGDGKLVHATVSSAGCKNHEQIVITNRSGKELLVDRDALATLIAALQQVQAALQA